MRIRLICFSFSYRSHDAVAMATAWNPNDRAESACVYVCPAVNSQTWLAASQWTQYAFSQNALGQALAPSSQHWWEFNWTLNQFYTWLHVKTHFSQCDVWGRVKQFGVRRGVVWCQVVFKGQTIMTGNILWWSQDERLVQSVTPLLLQIAMTIPKVNKQDGKF